MPTTNMPPTLFTEEGAIYPQPDELLAGACADIQAAFNNQLYLDSTDSASLVTPQGQLASTLTAVRLEKDSTLNYFSSMFDPNTCQGIWQDGMGAFFYNMKRLPALPTLVDVICTGLAGITIPAGAQVSDAEGNIYESSNAGLIDSSGTVVIQFANTVTGPIGCPIGAIDTIYNARGVIGWDSVVNLQAGLQGQNVETPQAFEARRQLSLGIYGHSQVSSMVGNVYRTVPNINMVFGAENDTDAPLVVLGVTLQAHSVYIAALGGADYDVAYAVFLKKSAGSAYNGNTIVVVYDTDGYNTPYPPTTVKFERPSAMPIFFSVEAIDDPALPADRDARIKAAIQAQFNGLNGAARAVIGSKINAGLYYAPVQAALPAVVLNSIHVGDTAAPTTSSVQVNADKYPSLDAANITINWV